MSPGLNLRTDATLPAAVKRFQFGALSAGQRAASAAACCCSFAFSAARSSSPKTRQQQTQQNARINSFNASVSQSSGAACPTSCEPPSNPVAFPPSRRNATGTPRKPSYTESRATSAKVTQISIHAPRDLLAARQLAASGQGRHPRPACRASWGSLAHK